MASHFPCIGIALKPRGLIDLVDQVVGSGHRTTTPHGDYVSWNAGMGPEVWVYLDGMNFRDMAPHFSGVSRIRCRLDNELHRENQVPQQVALQGWVGDDYPIVFDCPDYYVQGALSFPHECEVQLALFPEQVSAFGDAREFEESQRDRRMKYAPQSFTPSGLFVFGEGPPRSEVMASGEVVSAKTMTNPLTQSQFVAVQFKTFGGVFDLVFFGEEEWRRLQPGNIIMGEFWISGRILRSGGPPPLPKV